MLILFRGLYRDITIGDLKLISVSQVVWDEVLANCYRLFVQGKADVWLHQGGAMYQYLLEGWRDDK